MAKKSKSKTGAASGGSSEGVHQETYGPYLIKAGKLGNVFLARAFPEAASRSRGLIAEARGDSAEAAVEKLKSLIETQKEERIAKRRQDTRTGTAIPSEAEYDDALDQISLSRSQISMLKALATSAEDGLTPRQLANAAGYASASAAERNLRKASDGLARYLDIDSSAEGTASLVCLPASPGNVEADTSLDTWVMHLELRQALENRY
ncbi:hypothetical protein HKCCE3408_11925 [Rhodobacterales bacterium HKCCE3408]|nr:hypothetical protein [Rhodobacterales bacterium HKCCE3408]